MWEPNFMRIIGLTDNGAVLHDEGTNKVISLPDLKQIIQFELDGNIFGYQPNFHYNVVPDHPTGTRR
jgi:hypothetical protein